MPISSRLPRSDGRHLEIDSRRFSRRLNGVSDPMTGSFAVRRDALDLLTLRPRGFKILLEVLARTAGLRVGVVGFRFGERAAGDSKVNARDAYRYAGQHVRLKLAGVPALAEFLRFAVVGASGVAANLVVLAAALRLAGPRTGIASAQAIAETVATQAAILWNFVLAEMWVFRGDAVRLSRRARLTGYWLTSMLSLAVQLPMAAVLAKALPVGYVAETALTLLVLVAARFSVCRLVLYRRPTEGRCSKGTAPVSAVLAEEAA